MSKMAESAQQENLLSAVRSGTRELMDRAENIGWNSAINACREILPPEQSIKLRHLYRR